MKRTTRFSRRRGQAVIEFTLSCMVLIPLLLGAFVYGFRLIHSLEMEQVVRDLGRLYLNNVDFKTPLPGGAGQKIAAQLAASFDLTASGTSAVVFSRIRVVTQADCDANNVTPGIHCTNLGNPVFVEQIVIGNTSLTAGGVNIAKSVFGTPPLLSDKTVSPANQANNSAAAAGSTSGATGFAAVMLLNPGEYAYMVEMRNATPDLNIPGFSGSPQVYARSIF
jgi:hypothetical protein